MLIRVTQEHIDKGFAGNCSECPIALAVREALGDETVRVGPMELSLDRPPYHKILPRAVQEFIDRFDEGYRVLPFEFELEIN